jgi:hypothetical protein
MVAEAAGAGLVVLPEFRAPRFPGGVSVPLGGGGRADRDCRLLLKPLVDVNC